MKVRIQTPKPCEKKGLNNSYFANHCECFKECEQSGVFLFAESPGTQNHKTKFTGCMDIERYLVENVLIRYEMREDSGLEVLFDGIEKIYNLHSELEEYQRLAQIAPSEDLFAREEKIEQSVYSKEEAQDLGLFDEVDDVEIDFDELSEKDFANLEELKLEIREEQEVQKQEQQHSSDGSELLLNHLPTCLGFAQSKAHTIFARRPENLRDYFFTKLYSEGLFEKENKDVKDYAYYALNGFESEEDIKAIDPELSGMKLKEAKDRLEMLIKKNMPEWAKKFEQFLETLTSNQVEAVKREWFFKEDEKPTQYEIAANIGISRDSYQDRLEGAYKKLEKVYPEYDRVPRRRSRANQKKDPPAPLYLINPDGTKTQVPHPVAKTREAHFFEMVRIKKWAKFTTTDFLFEDYGL